MGPSPGERLASAVRRYISKPTTSNREAMERALEDFDAKATGAFSPRSIR